MSLTSENTALFCILWNDVTTCAVDICRDDVICDASVVIDICNKNIWFLNINCKSSDIFGKFGSKIVLFIVLLFFYLALANTSCFDVGLFSIFRHLVRIILYNEH